MEDLTRTPRKVQVLTDSQMACMVIRVLLALSVAAICCLPPVAGAAVISIKDLPMKPQVDCANAAVRKAFTACALGGASADCCQGLDAVLADPNSPSYACSTTLSQEPQSPT